KSVLARLWLVGCFLWFLARGDVLAGGRRAGVGRDRALEAGGEVAQEAVGDVLDHARAAEGGEGARDGEVGDGGGACGAGVGGERVDDRRAGVALAPLVGALG